MRHQRKFYLFCVFLSACFWLGTFFVWSQGADNKVPSSVVSTIVLVKKYEIQKEKINASAVEEQKRERNPLSERMNLDVPFTSQAPEKNWNQPWQDACEEAAALMADAYVKGYGLSPLFAKDEILKMISWEETRGWGVSISAEQIQQLMEEYSGLRNVQVKENPTVDDVKTFVASGNLVYVVADGKALPNPHFQNGGPVYHALVIRGYTEDSFITNDPGTQFGENFLYKYDELMGAIHDWNGGDVKKGKKIVLVVQ